MTWFFLEKILPSLCLCNFCIKFSSRSNTYHQSHVLFLTFPPSPPFSPKIKHRRCEFSLIKKLLRWKKIVALVFQKRIEALIFQKKIVDFILKKKMKKLHKNGLDAPVVLTSVNISAQNSIITYASYKLPTLRLISQTYSQYFRRTRILLIQHASKNLHRANITITFQHRHVFKKNIFIFKIKKTEKIIQFEKQWTLFKNSSAIKQKIIREKKGNLTNALQDCVVHTPYNGGGGFDIVDKSGKAWESNSFSRAT